MNIRTLAQDDLELILEDFENGTAQEVIFYDENKVGVTVNCWGADISAVIDPNTGLNVTQRTISIYARMSTLTMKDVFLKQNSKVTISSKNFIIKDFQPDRTLGIVAIMLEAI